MKKLEKAIAVWLIRRLMRRDYPNNGLVQLFNLIFQEAEEQFYEDNEPTRHGFLFECFVTARSINTKWPVDKITVQSETIVP